MGVYVITGGSTGIGAAVRQQLLSEGHEVFNIDYKDGDLEADLSTDEGVSSAIQAVEEQYPDGIDGLISNAGVGPTASPEKIFSLNFYAGVYIAEGLRPLLMKKRGCCVMTCSNSITNSSVRMDWVELLTNLRNRGAGYGFGPHDSTSSNRFRIQFLQMCPGPVGTPCLPFLGGRWPSHQCCGPRQHHHPHDPRSDRAAT